MLYASYSREEALGIILDDVLGRPYFVFRVHVAFSRFFFLLFVLFLRAVYPATLFLGLRKKSLGILPPCEAVSYHCFRQALQRLRFISWDEHAV